MPELTTATVKDLFTRNVTLKLLCLAMAFMVWCLSSTGRATESVFTLPVRVSNVPSGYSLSSAPPAGITYTLSGPSLLIGGVARSNKEVTLSLTGAARPGRTVFMHFESFLKLPEGVSVRRISPAVIEVNLVPDQTPAGGQHP